jgi:iron(III) transport system substrate-binding protein
MMRKKSIVLCLLFSLLSFGCKGKENAGTAAPSGVNGEVSARMAWAETNGINKTETAQELYEKAKLEGEVNVYSCTGRMETVAKTFMEDYPGITVNFFDLGINEMLEKFSREYEAGIRTADILQPKEQTGSIYYEYVSTGLLHNYQPEDIFSTIVDRSYLKVTPFVIELDWWNFNTEVYQDLPISSWWDITKPEWKGKFIFLDPAGEPDLPVLFTSMVQHPDIMAREYERVFGAPIQLAADEPNAAYAWIKRVARNGVILETSNTNIVKNVGGAAGMKDPPIGYGVSSKLRERDIQDWRLGVNPARFQTPTTAVSFMIAQVANEAPHPNAAKLFLRYLFGETNHQGKGIEPFMSAGSYPVFTDAVPFPNQPVWDSIPKFDLDLDYYYQNYLDVLDYWISVQP